MRWWLAVAVVVQVQSAWAGPPKRPAVDVQAMREAMGAPLQSQETLPSAASYAHFLKARLSSHDGQHRVAVDELRLALATDDGNSYLMTQLAEQLARVSELERAEAQLKRVIEKAPDYAPAQLLMGRVLLEAQKTARAKAHLAKAIKLRPTDSDAYLVLTQLWLEQGRVDEAIKVIEELGGAVPGEPVGYRRLGLALAERGEGARAEKLLLKAVDRDPGDAEAWVALGRIFETSSRADAAMGAYDRALERDPDRGEVLLLAGRLALKRAGPNDAKPYFDQLLSVSSEAESVVKVAFSYLAVNALPQAADLLDSARKRGDEPRLHFYAGLVLERLKRWKLAADAYSGVAESAGDLSLEARLHGAVCQSMLGQHRAALESLERLATTRPTLGGLTGAYGRALERAGQTKEAEMVLLRGFTKGASSDVVEALLGLYERAGRLQDAVALFSGAVARHPKEDTVVFALAAALDKKGDWAQAIELVRGLIDTNPAHSAALNFVGYTLAEHGGDLSEAERLVRKALETKPDSAAYLDSLGWVLFRKGEWNEAVTTLERAVAEAPDEVALLEHLGDALAKTKETTKARAAYARVVELLKADPEMADRKTQRVDVERKIKLLPIDGSRR
jgi:tetratricopeptide (TPR) repeat protein